MCKKLNLVFFPKHYSNVTWQFETLQTFQICQIWYLCKWMKIVWGERNLGTVVFLKSCSWCCKRFLSVSAFTRSKLPALLCNTFFVWSLWLHIICTSSLQESLPPGTDKWYTWEEIEGMSEPEANLTTEEIPLDIDEFNLETVDAVFILAVILVFVLIVAVVCR